MHKLYERIDQLHYQNGPLKKQLEAVQQVNEVMEKDLTFLSATTERNTE